MECVHALIEVKSAARCSNTLEIVMQESAQMAAWINDPANPVDQCVYTNHLSLDFYQE